MNIGKLITRMGLVAAIAFALIVALTAPGVGTIKGIYAESPDGETTVDVGDTADSPMDVVDEDPVDAAGEQTPAWDDITPVQGQVTVDLEAAGDPGVSGTVNLTAQDDGTEASFQMAGFAPGTTARSSLRTGTCDQPSASFAVMSELTADDNGEAAGSGPVLFRGTEKVARSTMTDGDHIITVAVSGQLAACGTIPRS